MVPVKNARPARRGMAKLELRLCLGIRDIDARQDDANTIRRPQIRK